MLKSILVGLDGSAYSNSATELGLEWAKRFDAMLVGLGVLDDVAVHGSEFVAHESLGYPKKMDADLVADARRKVEQFLERFALRCAAEKVACKLLEDAGSPEEQIIREAQRYDLVLLGRKSYFHFANERDSFDETVRKVVQRSPRPVVTVPENLGSGGPVIVGYDGSLQAARTLQAFEATGLGAGCQVQILCIDTDYNKAARCAELGADFLRSHDVRAMAYPLASTLCPGDVLMEQVRKLDPVMLVMGAYGHRGWRELLFGSVTTMLLKKSPVPIFLYH